MVPDPTLFAQRSRLKAPSSVVSVFAFSYWETLFIGLTGCIAAYIAAAALLFLSSAAETGNGREGGFVLPAAYLN